MIPARRSNGKARIIYDLRWMPPILSTALAPEEHVAPHGRWQVRRRTDGSDRGRTILEAPLKRTALRRMADILRGRWRVEGSLSQLVIRGKDGRILSERTYGLDPRRRAG
jgi:hypothetical protein